MKETFVFLFKTKDTPDFFLPAHHFLHLLDLSSSLAFDSHLPYL